MAANAINVLATDVQAFTGTSSSAALPGDSALQDYRLTATANCYVAFGLSGVAATNESLLVPTGESVTVKVPSGATHYAVIQDSAAGRLCISAVS